MTEIQADVWETLSTAPCWLCSLMGTIGDLELPVIGAAFASWYRSLKPDGPVQTEWVEGLRLYAATWDKHCRETDPETGLRLVNEALDSLDPEQALPYRKFLADLADAIGVAAGPENVSVQRLAPLISAQLNMTEEKIAVLERRMIAEATRRDPNRLSPDLELRRLEALVVEDRFGQALADAAALRARLEAFNALGEDAYLLSAIGETFAIEGRALLQSDPAEGERRLRDGIERMVAAGSPRASVYRSLLGHELRLTGQDAEARDLFNETIRELADAEAGNEVALGNATFGLGLMEATAGRIESAERLVNRAHAYFEACIDTLGVANADNELGRIALARGRFSEAWDRLTDARDRYESLGHGLGVANATGLLGEVASTVGRAGDAEALLQAAMELYAQGQDALGMANTAFELGKLALHRDDIEVAKRWTARAGEFYSRQHDQLGVANCTYIMAGIADASGDPDTARDLYALIQQESPDSVIAVRAQLREARLRVADDPLGAATLVHDAVARADAISSEATTLSGRLAQAREWRRALGEAIETLNESGDVRGAMAVALKQWGRNLWFDIETGGTGPSIASTHERVAFERERLKAARTRAGHMAWPEDALDAEARRLVDLEFTAEQSLIAEQPDVEDLIDALSLASETLLLFVWQPGLHLCFLLDDAVRSIGYDDVTARRIDAAISLIASETDVLRMPRPTQIDVWATALGALAKDLWAPLTPLLGDRRPRVCPDGDLALVPFETFGSGVRLIASLSSLTRQPSSQSLAAGVLHISPDPRGLPGVAVERSIVNSLGGRGVSDEQEINGLLTGLEPAEAHLVYVGSHASGAVTEHDAALHVVAGEETVALSPSDLLRLRIKCDILVISGCSSGVVGRGPSLLSAGACLASASNATIVAARYSVSDLGAALFALDVLPRLISGADIDQAVSEARHALGRLTIGGVIDRLAGLSTISEEAATAGRRLKEASGDMLDGDQDGWALPISDQYAWTVLGR